MSKPRLKAARFQKRLEAIGARHSVEDSLRAVGRDGLPRILWAVAELQRAWRGRSKQPPSPPPLLQSPHDDARHQSQSLLRHQSEPLTTSGGGGGSTTPQPSPPPPPPPTSAAPGPGPAPASSSRERLGHRHRDSLLAHPSPQPMGPGHAGRRLTVHGQVASNATSSSPAAAAGRRLDAGFLRSRTASPAAPGNTLVLAPGGKLTAPLVRSTDDPMPAGRSVPCTCEVFFFFFFFFFFVFLFSDILLFFFILNFTFFLFFFFFIPQKIRIIYFFLITFFFFFSLPPPTMPQPRSIIARHHGLVV
jgi:hypothetical protein